MEEDQYRGFGGEGEHVYREGVDRLRALLGGTRVAMFTTADETGALRSRPMVVQEITDEGEAWLVADEGSAKVHAVRREWHVNLAWVRPVRGRWLSATGRATVVQDREKLRTLWDPTLEAWFPNGADDPRLCLLRVRLDEAMTWDAPLGNLMQVKRLAASLLGRPRRSGEAGRDTIVIRTRQAGVGDTAGILGAAGGSVGVAPRMPWGGGGPRVAGAAGGRLGEAPARSAPGTARAPGEPRAKGPAKGEVKGPKGPADGPRAGRVVGAGKRAASERQPMKPKPAGPNGPVAEVAEGAPPTPAAAPTERGRGR